MKKEYFVHESSCVDEPVSIGEGTKIWHFCHISKGARIGRNCKMGQNVFVGSTAVIGDNVKIQNNVSVYDGVILEDYVFCGPSMVFTNIVNPRCAFPRNTPDHYLKTLIGHHASIGANATIVCGNTIGCHAFVGAGAVVTKDVPEYAIMTGVPARVSGWMCECGVTLKAMSGEVACEECGREFSIGKDGARKRE